MDKFIGSPKMFYLLAVLLVLVFFLPDLIGPLPALACGVLVIASALRVYQIWSREDNKEAITEEGEHPMLIDLLRSRRSIRKFQDQPVEPEKLAALIEAMLRSPSSRGLNPWEFVVVSDRRTIAALARAKAHGSAFLAGAPVAVVVCADPEKSDVWIEDASIAALIVHLGSTDLGLGSCWIQIRSREHDDQTSAASFVAETLGLRAGLTVEAIIAIGYAAEEKPGRGADTLLRDRVHRERYGQPW